jgi:hypothetical protein
VTADRADNGALSPPDDVCLVTTLFDSFDYVVDLGFGGFRSHLDNHDPWTSSISLNFINLAHLEAAGLVDDAPEDLCYGSFVEWSGVDAARTVDDLSLACAVADRQPGVELRAPYFEREFCSPVE